MKPGYRTTEFWLSLVAAILGFVTASGAVPEENKIVGGAVGILAIMGYTVSRGIVKTKGPA